MEKIELIKSGILIFAILTLTTLIIIFYQSKKKKGFKQKRQRHPSGKRSNRIKWNIDPEIKERLIQYELKRMPGLSREKAERWAKDRLERDNR